MEWISTKIKHPDFNEYVLVWCKIYGIFLATYEHIGDFNGDSYGNWRDSKGNLGILPPEYWMPLPEYPKQNT